MARPPAPRAKDVPAVAEALAVSDLGLALQVARADVLESWRSGQSLTGAFRNSGMSETQLAASSKQLVDALIEVLVKGTFGVDDDPSYSELIWLVGGFSADRARLGYTPRQTAVAIMSLKEALVASLRAYYGDGQALAAATLEFDRAVDVLALAAFDAFVTTREEIITSQQQSLMELSTPVVKLWDGIVAVPLIGTLDSYRTQTVMESLLQAIVDTESRIAIIDITGVMVVDTLVAQHLLKTVAATRLMGADCIISGIRPGIAQTMVHLGIDLSSVITRATLADALKTAMALIGESRTPLGR